MLHLAVESSKVGNLQRLEEVFHYCLSTTWIKVFPSPLHTLMKLHTLEPVQELNLKLDIQIHGRHVHFLAGKAVTVAATSAACRRRYLFCKIQAGLGLGGLASRGGPELSKVQL
jgi:hypothetical protein